MMTKEQAELLVTALWKISESQEELVNIQREILIELQAQRGRTQ
jgi:hypothetical protein